jgi:hypothetical protein
MITAYLWVCGLLKSDLSSLNDLTKRTNLIDELNCLVRRICSTKKLLADGKRNNCQPKHKCFTAIAHV